MNELALFAGAGGGILGGKLLGWRTVCAVEIDSFCRRVLLARQRDGMLGRFPIWDDVTTFDGDPWRGRVDVVSGGFPCQDISHMGKGEGIEGKRSGLWAEMARIVGEVQPKFVFVENSPMLLVRGLHRVLGDLATLGYDARWGIILAENAGAPHKRKRIWILAYSDRERQEIISKWFCRSFTRWCCHSGTWGGRRMDQPGIVRVVDGVADQLDRIGAVGNGQVPAVVKLAWEILSEGLVW